MADNRGITDLPLEIYTGAMPKAGVSDTQVSSIMGTLSNSCRGFHQFFKEHLKQKVMQRLWQAVIDDHRQIIIKIATAQPQIFLQALVEDAADGYIIQSKYTHQKFDLTGENILSVAVKRKQIEMIKLLLGCVDKLEQANALKERITDTLAQWQRYEIQQEAQNDSYIVAPSEYGLYAESLVNVLSAVIFPSDSHKKLPDEAEHAFSLLYDVMLPNRAIKLDDYIDPELFLIALHAVYRCRVNTLQLEQRNTFFIRVIGLVQSVIAPETAKILCEGFSRVFSEKVTMSERAEALKLLDDKSFYRASPESRTGLGFDYGCLKAKAEAKAPYCPSIMFELIYDIAWIPFAEQKQIAFDALYSHYSNSQTMTQQMTSGSTM